MKYFDELKEKIEEMECNAPNRSGMFIAVTQCDTSDNAENHISAWLEFAAGYIGREGINTQADCSIYVSRGNTETEELRRFGDACLANAKDLREALEVAEAMKRSLDEYVIMLDAMIRLCEEYGHKALKEAGEYEDGDA